MNGTERRQEAKRVATDIAEDARVVELAQHLVQGCIDIAMAAALAKLWRARSHHIGRSGLSDLNAQCLRHDVGRQFARTRQLTRETSENGSAIAYAAHLLFDKRLPLFHYEHALTLAHKLAYQFFWERILRNLKQRTGRAGVSRKDFADVIVSNSTCYDAKRRLRACVLQRSFKAIVVRDGSIGLELWLLRSHLIVAPPSIGWQKHPVSSLSIVVDRILATGFNNHSDNGTGMSHTRGNTQ